MALEEAKRTLMEKYLLVGTTERMREMIALLDATLPDFFQGALDHFDSLDGEYTVSGLTPGFLWANSVVFRVIVNFLVKFGNSESTHYFFQSCLSFFGSI